MEAQQTGDPNNILIHSFELDQEADQCMIPVIWPRKQVLYILKSITMPAFEFSLGDVSNSSSIS